jgi:hypothetical protein
MTKLPKLTLFPFLVRTFTSIYQPPRRMSGGNINQKTKNMQNKPNLRNDQMNTTPFTTRPYKKFTRRALWRANPIKPKFYPPSFVAGKPNHPVRSSNSSILSECLNFCSAISSICRTRSLLRPRSCPICCSVFFFFFIKDPTRPK